MSRRLVRVARRVARRVVRSSAGAAKSFYQWGPHYRGEYSSWTYPAISEIGALWRPAVYDVETFLLTPFLPMATNPSAYEYDYMQRFTGHGGLSKGLTLKFKVRQPITPVCDGSSYTHRKFPTDIRMLLTVWVCDRLNYPVEPLNITPSATAYNYSRGFCARVPALSSQLINNEDFRYPLGMGVTPATTDCEATKWGSSGRVPNFPLFQNWTSKTAMYRDIDGETLPYAMSNGLPVEGGVRPLKRWAGGRVLFRKWIHLKPVFGGGGTLPAIDFPTQLVTPTARTDGGLIDPGGSALPDGMPVREKVVNCRLRFKKPIPFHWRQDDYDAGRRGAWVEKVPYKGAILMTVQTDNFAVMSGLVPPITPLYFGPAVSWESRLDWQDDDK